MDTGSPGIGHNNPLEALKADLAERHAKLIAATFDLVEEADGIPAVVASDTDVARISDLAEKCKKVLARIEIVRKDEKEVFLRGGQTVDQWFKDRRSDLDEALERLRKLPEAYLRAKLQAERKRREEEERQRAEAEQKRLAEAAAERRRHEEAEAAAAAERARLAKEEADRLAADEKSAADAVAAAQETAAQAELEAEAAAEQVAAPVEPPPVVMPAAVTDPRVRVAGHGGRAMGKEVWTWRYVGRGLEEFDLNRIRDYIDPGEVARALNAAVKAGLRQAGPGIEIFKDVKVVL